MPGADLVGFRKVDEDQTLYKFAFGEVKTSSDENYPPNIVYGKTGLHSQLENLRDNKKIRDLLVKYLTLRVQPDWFDIFQTATKNYFSSDVNVSLYGILVRDVEYNKNDLERRVEKLADNIPNNMDIFLFAIYFPKTSIGSFQNFVNQISGDDN